jgi:branched-chain amino acid transport system substrate-binding protein
VGFCDTGVAMNALEVFQSRKQVLIIPVATGSALTEKYPAASSYIFRVAPSDSVQAALLVDDIMKRGFTKVAIFADRTPYGDGGLKDVQGLLAEHRLKPVHVARFDVGTKSLAAEMQEAKAAGAEAIVGYGMGPELAVMARARVDAKLNAALYGPWTLSLRGVGEQAQQAVEGAVMAQTIVGDISNERRLSFIMRLKRHAGTQPIGSLMAAAQSYDAVQMMMRAVFQAKGDVSGDALKRALENPARQYQGVVTTHETPFSAQDHDAFTRNMVWLGVWRKGEVRFHRPEDAKRVGYVRRKDSTAWWD